MCYNLKGQTYVHKGFFNFTDFYDAYVQHKDLSMIIHLRMATLGEVGTPNCHPFDLKNGFMAAHNGIISGYGNKDVSDTREFLKKKVTACRIMNDLDGIGKEIGLGNKIAFMHPDGKISIANETMGHWLEGVWYSNYGYKEYTYTQDDYYGYTGAWKGYSNFGYECKNGVYTKKLSRNSGETLSLEDKKNECMSLANEIELESLLMELEKVKVANLPHYIRKKLLNLMDSCEEELEVSSSIAQIGGV